MPTEVPPPSKPVTSWYRVGTTTVRIDAHPDTADPLRGALVDLAVDPPPGGLEPEIEIIVAPTESGYRVEHDRGATDHPSVATTIDGVVSALNLATLHESPSHAHLHAGGITVEDRAILLIAPTGAGKTTLTAAAVEAGLGYLSDERVGIDSAGMAHPYHKPLSIKQGSWPLLPHLEPSDADDHHRIWQIPASRISPETDHRRALSGPTRPGLILRVRHDPEAEPLFEPISRGAAVAAMILNSMDFDVIGPDTIVWFARAAASSRTGTLVSGALGPTVALVRLLVAEHVQPGLEPEVVAVATGTGPHDGRADAIAATDVASLREGTTVVGIDDELLLHEPETRQALVLNPSASAIVARIDGQRSWADLAAATGSDTDAAVLALATDLGRRGLLAGVARTTDPPQWHDLTLAAKQPEEDHQAG